MITVIDIVCNSVGLIGGIFGMVAYLQWRKRRVFVDYIARKTSGRNSK